MERDDIKDNAKGEDTEGEIQSTLSQPQAEKAKVQDSEAVPEPTEIASPKRVY